MLRHYFAGGNTSKGFVGFFSKLCDVRRMKRIIILKGGPGVGKSTLMKKIAEELALRDQRVDHVHCASDPDSLDAVLSGGVAIVDGTAPHIVDPALPGAVDGIVNLGEFLDEKLLRTKKSLLLPLNDEIGKRYARSFRYLAAAERIMPSDEMPDEILFQIFREARALLPDKPREGALGVIRELFATAITPKGIVSHIPKCARVYAVQADFGQSVSPALNRLAEQAAMLGLEVERHHCALRPDRTDHVHIPALDILFTTENAWHAGGGVAEIIKALPASGATRFEYETVESLLEKAVGCLKEAKGLHDELEAYYIDAMDYDGISWASRRLIDRLSEQ